MAKGRGPRSIVAASLAVCWLSALTSTGQEPAAPPAADRFTLVGRSETYFQLYRRALLPGQNGASVPTETAAPIHEYLFASARDIDAPWQRDCIGVEFAAWARFWPTQSSLERPFDGDVQTAHVRVQAGPVSVWLGRQQVAGGAARFTRLDGVRVAAHKQGFFVEGYGGFLVLPRWNEQPGYHRLGDAQEELLVDPPPPLPREQQWLAGARAGYSTARASASLSFHEQRQNAELDQRNLGLDLSARLFEAASLGGAALLELDSRRLADARLWLDAAPHPRLDLNVEARRAEPALLLSRQSVLSVFTSDGYEELGGTLTLRGSSWLRFEGSGYLALYDDGDPGGRLQVAARAQLDGWHPTLVRIAYARVSAPENGYNSLRTSLSRQFTERVAATLEAYGYFYDEAIAGASTSALGAATVSFRVLDALELLWSGSLAHSPYARLDAQTLLRASYQLDVPARARGL